MVNIEKITVEREKRKPMVERAKDLLNKFFDNVYITNTSVFISVSKNEQSDPFLFVNFSYTELHKMRLFVPEYYKKTLAFAKEYEKKFNVSVTLQTDYSK